MTAEAQRDTHFHWFLPTSGDGREVIGGLQSAGILGTASAIRPTGSITLRCDEGCTFIRSARRRPGRVRCPSDQRRTCPVGDAAVPA